MNSHRSGLENNLPMKARSLPLFENIRAFPAPHANFQWTKCLRELILAEKFDLYTIDLFEEIKDLVIEGVQELPLLSVVTMSSEEESFVLPIDPCDSWIEIIRSNLNNPDRILFTQTSIQHTGSDSPWIPDGSWVKGMEPVSFQASISPLFQKEILTQGIAQEVIETYNTLQGIKKKKVLVFCNQRNYYHLYKLFHDEAYHSKLLSCLESSRDIPDVAKLERFSVRPEQAYFALNEIPFYVGEIEKNRRDPFAQIPELTDLIKQLWIQTRWDYLESEEEIRKIPTTKIQKALQYLRNLSFQQNKMNPGLMDLVEAAQGVFGDTFASRVLEAARFYPFFDPIEENIIELRPESLIHPIFGELKSTNIFRDSNLEWREIQLRPEPTKEKMQEYRYSWDPSEMCSHMPEDLKIEQFNKHLRSAALRQVNEELSRSEEFTSSTKDGLDIRATLRNWHTGKIFVKESPPKAGSLDTVIILFDTKQDQKYPHQTVWFAEHMEESTLTFYSTDPFDKMIGPGVAEANYGGLSLLYPPKWTPDPFRNPLLVKQCQSKAEIIVASALQNSSERNVCILSPSPPSMRMKRWAKRYNKRIIHMPFAKFSSETLERLRKFHVLNGKHIRSYARRFIGY